MFTMFTLLYLELWSYIMPDMERETERETHTHTERDTERDRKEISA